MTKQYILRNTSLPTYRPSGLDYRKELNDAQYQAATTVEGPLLIIAGAGTGKTRTLVYRVAHLIDIGVDPRSILLLTFTRRAAEEMLRRASLLIDSRCNQVAGGTFHSFANQVLRRYGNVIGLKSPGKVHRFCPAFRTRRRSDANRWMPKPDKVFPGPIAQLGERHNGIVEVSGSTPLCSTKR